MPLLLALAALQSPPVTSIPERIDAYLREELETRHVPGCSVAVVRDGAVVLEKGYGLANVELGVSADASTVYELLSVSKQFTASAVMLLAEEGKVSLEDPVASRLDGLAPAWKDVTVGELLAHTSGIPDYVDEPGWYRTIREERTAADLVSTVASKPLLFAPGTQWKYSNTNYLLLGELVAKLGGKPFETFVAERVFRPLGMESARFESFSAILPHRASGYHLGKDGLANATWVDPSHKGAAGGFVASVHDLAKWAVALDTRALLKPASHERMIAPAVLAGGAKADYGIANELSVDRGHRVAGHQGGGLAFNAALLRYVDDKLSVAVLCNLTQAPSSAWARHIASFYVPALAEAEPAIEDADPAFTTVFRGVLVDAAKGSVNPDLFAESVRVKMKNFIEHTGPRFLGPVGALESLVAIASTGSVPGASGRTARYRAKFEKASMTWTVELDAAGKIVSMEPTLE